MSGPSVPFGRRLFLSLEDRWDSWGLRRSVAAGHQHFRIICYAGHGAARVAVRGRVVDNPPGSVPSVGEHPVIAVRRTIGRFVTWELPRVPLRIRLGTADVEVLTDDEGYFELIIDAGLGLDDGPWAEGSVALAERYGEVVAHEEHVRIRVPTAAAKFGVISDIDDTILVTGAQQAWRMVLATVSGSSLTRKTYAGAPELYRALAAEGDEPDANPVFYVSSSPWNLDDFITEFLAHHAFPAGPLLLRDLLGRHLAVRSHTRHKVSRIEEILDLHPDLRFVLVGDSGQHDPAIYAQIAERHPGRIIAAYIREVRLDPADGRVETVVEGWPADVPFELFADSAQVARHAHGLGLVSADAVDQVERSVQEHTDDNDGGNSL